MPKLDSRSGAFCPGSRVDWPGAVTVGQISRVLLGLSALVFQADVAPSRGGKPLTVGGDVCKLQIIGVAE